MLGYEAAGYGSQLEHLLAEPEMQALIAALPGLGRVLRPLKRMLGLVDVAVAAVVDAVRAPVEWVVADEMALAGFGADCAIIATTD